MPPSTRSSDGATLNPVGAAPTGIASPRAQAVLAPGDLAPGPVPLGLHLEGRFWLTIGASGYAGEGRVALLEAIDQHGSLNKAAKALGLSYKSAWDALQFLNNAAGVSLVDASTGGRGGGGSRLTPSGRWLVEVFNRVKSVHRQFLDALAAAVARSAEAGQGAGAPGALERLFLRTSARNQWLGTVAEVREEGVSAEVTVELGGQTLRARLTAGSVRELGLEPGTAVWALVKAQGVAFLAPGEALPDAQRHFNRLAGTVVSVTSAGAMDREVALALPGGNMLYGVVAKERAEALGLPERFVAQPEGEGGEGGEEAEPMPQLQPLSAAFDPGLVILGVLA